MLYKAKEAVVKTVGNRIVVCLGKNTFLPMFDVFLTDVTVDVDDDNQIIEITGTEQIYVLDGDFFPEWKKSGTKRWHIRASKPFIVDFSSMENGNE